MATGRSISITGLGAVTPLGVGVAAFVRALREGRSGTRVVGNKSEGTWSGVAAECRDFEPTSVLSKADAERLPRLVPMALAACLEACGQAGLAVGEGLGARAQRVGLVLGTGGGGIDFTLDQAKEGYSGGRLSLWTITNATHGNLSGELSIRLGLRGPSLCISTGCASSSDAVGMALEMLRSDRPGAPEAMVVVGADAHVRWETMTSMALLRVLTTRTNDERSAATASRPFDRTRDGFVLGEGAWAILMEREGSARSRGAREIARVEGYGATCDAYHRVRPDPEMRESARAMEEALEDAGRRADEVEVVQYHGTGTVLNDMLETQAVKMALGAHASRVRGHAVKSMIGHPQGACGLAGLVATVGGLTAQDSGLGGEEAGPFLHPTINLTEADPACDLDYTPLRSAATGARVVLVNCLAFGAKNSALVVSAG